MIRIIMNSIEIQFHDSDHLDVYTSPMPLRSESIVLSIQNSAVLTPPSSSNNPHFPFAIVYLRLCSDAAHSFSCRPPSKTHLPSTTAAVS